MRSFQVGLSERMTRYGTVRRGAECSTAFVPHAESTAHALTLPLSRVVPFSRIVVVIIIIMALHLQHSNSSATTESSFLHSSGSDETTTENYSSRSSTSSHRLILARLGSKNLGRGRLLAPTALVPRTIVHSLYVHTTVRFLRSWQRYRVDARITIQRRGVSFSILWDGAIQVQIERHDTAFVVYGTRPVLAGTPPGLRAHRTLLYPWWTVREVPGRSPEHAGSSILSVEYWRNSAESVWWIEESNGRGRVRRPATGKVSGWLEMVPKDGRRVIVMEGEDPAVMLSLALIWGTFRRRRGMSSSQRLERAHK